MIIIKRFYRIYLIVIILFSIYILLDTFVIVKEYKNVSETKTLVKNSETGNVNKSDYSYQDDNIKIELKEYQEYDTSIYVADILLSDSSYLQTALANNKYGKNVTATTSTIASGKNAILAINGDFYGAQEYGYVLKQGVLYRSSAKTNQEDLVIYEDGSWEFINESYVDIDRLINKKAYNILAFGPALIKDGSISVTTSSEVGKSMASNPRTAVGKIDDNHYVFVVSDGRTSNSVGLSLYQLASFMKKIGVIDAYNLDGGGSSTMYFNGKIINNPTTTGNKISERKVSDILYVGY